MDLAAIAVSLASSAYCCGRRRLRAATSRFEGVAHAHGVDSMLSVFLPRSSRNQPPPTPSPHLDPNELRLSFRRKSIIFSPKLHHVYLEVIKSIICIQKSRTRPSNRHPMHRRAPTPQSQSGHNPSFISIKSTTFSIKSVIL